MRASTWIHWVCLVQWLVARAEGHGDATCMLQHKVQESLDPAFDCQDGAGIEAFCAKNPKVTAKGVMCTVKCDSDGAVREIVHDAVSLEDASGSTWSVLEPDPEKLQWHYTGYFLKLTVKLDPGEPLCLWRALCSKEEKDGIIEHHKHDATPVTEDDFWTLKFGYLTVPLDYDNTKPSHEITLSLRVSALIGPAGPHAPLILQHNGGPVSDDLDVLYGVLSKKPDLYNTSPTSAMVKAYTVIGIQQRGMSSYAGIGNGRFEPLPVKSKEFLKVCDGKDLTPAPGKSHYDLRDFTSCECNLPEESNPWSRCLGDKPSRLKWRPPDDGLGRPPDDRPKSLLSQEGVEVPSPFPDPEDEAEMMKWFEFTASRNRNCYNSPYWEMKVSSGGKDYTYNFLDYVGTQMLAMDLDRLREALGAKTLSINGLSYGTAVGAAYAGAFPKSVDKLILNGNVVPGHDVSDYYEYTALASRQGLTKLVQMCWNARYDKTELHKDKIQELCNMDGFDPVEFFMKVVAKVKAEADGATSGSSLYSLPTELNTRFTMTPAMLYQFMNRPISSGTAGQWQNVLEKLSDLGGSNKTRLETATRAVFDEVCANSVTSVGQRDWEVYGYCKEFILL
ncbi:unnamed protein product [Durusdinium trenchii]|uniref:AB hydrolase-1 domain-containing protein n=1 Tax=Durusdinium trenchii TaxID=1381693 RepID=A0ABP0QDC5_9DINO